MLARPAAADRSLAATATATATARLPLSAAAAAALSQRSGRTWASGRGDRGLNRVARQIRAPQSSGRQPDLIVTSRAVWDGPCFFSDFTSLIAERYSAKTWSRW